MLWNMASVSRRTLCSKSAPAYCSELGATVILLGGGGDDDEALREDAELGLGRGGEREDVGAGLARDLGGVDRAGGGAGARGDDEEVALSDGRSGDLACDMHGEAEVHETHGGHSQRQSAATCAGYKYAAGGEDHALRDGDLGFVDGGEGGVKLLEDHGPVRRVALEEGAVR